MEAVVDMDCKGVNPSEIAQAAGVSRLTVYRIKDGKAAAEKALATWGL
jgi:DNA invertase Pin-like site-specific DNA recombinase